ncbi:superfamily II DNA/RNA helicase, SNF2 family, ATP-dependent [Haemophilus pittmaniae]|uniref:Superfamily II DNA/RNA helicase, SNF2 family, ATP-dependent n=2 Tax=Haemophilus pittmaniae TaxID=249188 RepID=A0A377IXC7_9PAST|nr:superfamily II DNA/RNA helicase, SNF2 family, ATP-dependent [Haemophilus pittmaniae]
MEKIKTMPQSQLTPHQARYYSWLLTRQAEGGSMDSLATTLVDAQVDLNPHQVDAALFACKNPLSKGVILADEVGLGKTIEAGLVILQHWAERKRKILIITPANLRKQWHQELQEKFGLQGMILEAKSYNAIKKTGKNPFRQENPVICSYQFAKSKADDIKQIGWDLVVLDEAHRLRNVYKKNNVIGKTLKEALENVSSKVLLTATPLQNSLLELYGLVSMIDDRVFGDLDSFRAQFGAKATEQTLFHLRQRLNPVCQRTLRRQVQAYVPYTQRLAILQKFTPSDQEREFSHLVAEYLRRPNLQAMPEGQRQLISLVLWKLLASSSRAIAGALDTMTKRLQGVLAESTTQDLVETLDEDYESLDETAEEWEEESESNILTADEYQAIADEIEELKHFKQLAENIREDAKSRALLTALSTAFAKLKELGAAQKAIIFTESKRTQAYRQTPKDVSRIKQMLFGSFSKCLYPLQKFDSDTERRFAVILERDAQKWFKPAQGQFQIYWKSGFDSKEYIPDFVVETKDSIWLVETKAGKDLKDPEVLAKADAAFEWCKHATDYALQHNGKHWRYVLIPHDEVVESKKLADFLRFEKKSA